jgi:hypothetical protein
MDVCIAKSQNITEIKDPRARDMCLGRDACLSSVGAWYGCQCHEGYCVGSAPPKNFGRPGRPGRMRIALDML